MSGKGNSKAKTTSTSSTTTVNNIDNRVYASDQGAIDSAFEFAETTTDAILTTVQEAFDFAGDSQIEAQAAVSEVVRDGFEAVSESSRSALDFAGDALTGSLDFADAASERQSGTFREAFEFGRQTSEGAADFAANLFQSSLDAVTGVVAEGQLQLGNTVSNLNAIARQQSTSSDERIEGIARYAIVGVGAVVALIALAFILRR
jgi:cobalamin biosynthesis Mg chelatase CobN